MFMVGPDGEKIQIGPPPPTHAVLSPAQQAAVTANFEAVMERARVCQVTFRLDAVDFEQLEADPPKMLSLSDSIEEGFENLTKGDATVTLEAHHDGPPGPQAA